MENKLCSRCKVWKETKEFSKNKNYVSGLNYYCKSCMKEARENSVAKKPEFYENYHKEYYQKNREKFLQKRKEYYLKTKENK